MFYIFNKVTKTCVGKRATIKAARRAVDKFDNAYGAYVHYIVDRSVTIEHRVY